jgi:nucleoside-diphosphate-sugar epimerase
VARDLRNLHESEGFLSVGDIGPASDWTGALENVDVVVHLAARVHIMRDKTGNPLEEFRKVNVAGTEHLAKAAAASGVKRFVYVSSIGVNGFKTASGKAFSESDKPDPHNAYALSKWEAEQGLLRIAHETGLEVVIIRPPLVYGCNAPGNFGALMRVALRRWPLPLGAVHNQRSLVAVDNLVDFIITCIAHSQAANQIFLVSDGRDVSTTELVLSLRRAAGVPALLMPLPIWVLQAGATLLGKRNVVQQLCGNLQVDISKAQQLLGWVPPVSIDEGLLRAVVGHGLPRR